MQPDKNVKIPVYTNRFEIFSKNDSEEFVLKFYHSYPIMDIVENPGESLESENRFTKVTRSEDIEVASLVMTKADALSLLENLHIHFENELKLEELIKKTP